MPGTSQCLPKSERLHSKKVIDRLFGGGGSKSMSAFPLRLVYMPVSSADAATSVTKGKVPVSNGNAFVEYDDAPHCQILVSVPKRCLHRANKRNLVKRQIREAYRKNKGIIDGLNIVMAFIWLDGKTYPADVVEKRMVNLLTRMREKVGA